MLESRKVNTKQASEIEGLTRERDQMKIVLNTKYFELEVNYKLSFYWLKILIFFKI